jgi:hypothetical protein
VYTSYQFKYARVNLPHVKDVSVNECPRRGCENGFTEVQIKKGATSYTWGTPRTVPDLKKILYSVEAKASWQTECDPHYQGDGSFIIVFSTPCPKGGGVLKWRLIDEKGNPIKNIAELGV